MIRLCAIYKTKLCDSKTKKVNFGVGGWVMHEGRVGLSENLVKPWA